MSINSLLCILFFAEYTCFAFGAPNTVVRISGSAEWSVRPYSNMYEPVASMNRSHNLVIYSHPSKTFAPRIAEAKSAIFARQALSRRRKAQEQMLVSNEVPPVQSVY